MATTELNYHFTLNYKKLNSKINAAMHCIHVATIVANDVH